MENITASKAITRRRKAVPQKSRSGPIASKGIQTGHDFANLMAALMSDLIDGRVTPSIGNACCNAGGKLLKVVEMQLKYGTQSADSGERTLSLAVGWSEPKSHAASA